MCEDFKESIESLIHSISKNIFILMYLVKYIQN
jgi:hypothetical protein